ncbi:MAG: hypothetical protein ACM3VT_17350 [Solirubrobacterales bacterium]
MKTAEIHRNHQASLILAAIAVLLGASIFTKVMGFCVERGRMQGVAGWNRGEADPNALKNCLSEAKKTADAIRQKNLFIKEPPKEHPIKQVDGILGDEAFIAGKWYKAGEKVGDATIVEVLPTFVKVEWDGKTTNLAPIGAAESARPSPPPAANEPKKETPAESKTETKAAVAATPAAKDEVVEEEDPLGWLGVRMSPRLRAMLLEKWNGASDEEKARAKEEWNKMSDSEKQRIVDEMEKQM